MALPPHAPSIVLPIIPKIIITNFPPPLTPIYTNHALNWWSFRANDRFNNQLVEWNVASNRFETQYFNILFSRILTNRIKSWSLACTTNHPPVPFSSVGGPVYFVITNYNSGWYLFGTNYDTNWITWVPHK